MRFNKVIVKSTKSADAIFLADLQAWMGWRRRHDNNYQESDDVGSREDESSRQYRQAQRCSVKGSKQYIFCNPY